MRGTRDNAFNLAPNFVETVLSRYRDTRLGRQEIDGEIIEERTRRAVDARRTRCLPRARRRRRLQRIVVAVDPPGSARQGADACGLVAAGRAAGRHASMCWPTRAPAASRRRAGR